MQAYLIKFFARVRTCECFYRGENSSTCTWYAVIFFIVKKIVAYMLPCFVFHCIPAYRVENIIIANLGAFFCIGFIVLHIN